MFATKGSARKFGYAELTRQNGTKLVAKKQQQLCGLSSPKNKFAVCRLVGAPFAMVDQDQRTGIASWRSALSDMMMSPSF
jgi:hypothetical protein